MCGPEDPLFTPLLQLARVPFQAKESVHKTPFWENLEILACTASIFTQILAHKPPNLEIFSSQAPNLEIFRSQAPLFRGICQFASPTLQKSGPHTPTRKKSWVPPGGLVYWHMGSELYCKHLHCPKRSFSKVSYPVFSLTIQWTMNSNLSIMY